jgi:hypothetical protein
MSERLGCSATWHRSERVINARVQPCAASLPQDAALAISQANAAVVP